MTDATPSHLKRYNQAARDATHALARVHAAELEAGDVAAAVLAMRDLALRVGAETASEAELTVIEGRFRDLVARVTAVALRTFAGDGNDEPLFGSVMTFRGLGRDMLSVDTTPFVVVVEGLRHLGDELTDSPARARAAVDKIDSAAATIALTRHELASVAAKLERALQTIVGAAESVASANSTIRDVTAALRRARPHLGDLSIDIFNQAHEAFVLADEELARDHPGRAATHIRAAIDIVAEVQTPSIAGLQAFVLDRLHFALRGQRAALTEGLRVWEALGGSDAAAA